MAVNDILPFCPTDTGTNLLSEADYIAAANRTIGNQPGVASSKLNNKAIRQATYIVSQYAQYISNKTSTDVLDDANPTKLLAQINAAVLPLAPQVTSYTSGSGNHDMTYNFFIASGSATIGATYTNNSVTYTVKATVASSLQVRMNGNGAPTVSGTLTKASGTGDATITFYAVRAPVSYRVRLVGGGGGGAGSGTGAGNGTDATNTTFGTSLLSGTGGARGLLANPAATNGGTASLGTGPIGLALQGGNGGGGPPLGTSPGGGGGNGFFGAGGSGGAIDVGGTPASPNTGGGGGGAGGSGVSTGVGGGGGAGGFVDAIIVTPLTRYAYVVGAKGTGGTLGTGGKAGGNGADGNIVVEENYQ